MRRLRATTGAGLTPVLACLALGCGALPHSQLAECRQRSQALQAEATQLKNEALGLRDRNRELAQRAIEDAHQIHTLKQSNSRLEKSLLAYQEERNRLVEAFEQLQNQIRTAAATSPPLAGIDRLESFARAHPGCRFDAARRALTIPCELLFPPTSDALTPASELVLTALGRLLSDPDTGLASGRVVIRSLSPSGVVRAAADTSKGSAGAELGRRRAGHVRDLLEAALNGSACRVEMAESQEPLEMTMRASADSTEAIAIEIEPRTESGSLPSGS